MKNKNTTATIFQKIANAVNNIESKMIKDVTPTVKPSKKPKSVYDNIINHIEKNKLGENENERK